MNYDQNIQFYPYVASWLNDYIINSWKQEQFLLSLLFIFPIHWVQCSARNEVEHLTFTKMKLLWNIWLPPPRQKILISISDSEHKLPLSLWPTPLRFIPLNNCIVTIYKALCYYDDAYIIGCVSTWGWLSWSAARPPDNTESILCGCILPSRWFASRPSKFLKLTYTLWTL